MERQKRSCPTLSGGSQSVLEVVRMFAVHDRDGHRASQPLQFTGAGVWHHADGQLRRPARHRAAVLQHEGTIAAVQTSGDLLDSDVTGRSLDARHGAQHLAFAGGFQAAMELFVDGHSADGWGFAAGWLGSQFYLECSSGMRGHNSFLAVV